MANFTWSGFWDNGTTYQTNTFVTYENVVYVSLSPNISSTPSSGNTDWDIVVYGQGSTYIERTPLPTVTPTPTDTPSVTPTSTETPTPTPTITNTQTPSHTPVGTQTPTPTVTETPTNTPTNTETPTNTPTPSTTPIPVTGYGYNLVAIPYNFPESGNSIMNNPGDNTSGSTEINLLSTIGRGFYFNSIDSSSVDRTNYYSGFTGQSITITFSQTGNTAIYSGDTDSLKYWDTPLGTGFVFGTGIGVPPNNIPSGTAVLIQSATTQFTIGLPVYISIEINGNVTPTPTVTQTPTPTETPTPTGTPSSTSTPTPTPTSGGGWFFFFANGATVTRAPNNNGETVFYDGLGNSVYNPNYTSGILRLSFNNINTAGTSYASQFSTLNNSGGTITISQGSSTVIYSGTSTDYVGNASLIRLDVTSSAQMIQSASTPFVSGTTINVVVS